MKLVKFRALGVSFLRKMEMLFEEISFLLMPDLIVQRPRVFNLDLHIAVNADLKNCLESKDVSVTTWSISRHNHLIHGRRPIPDPVAWINARNWQDLTIGRIKWFIRRYWAFLIKFEGFIVTLPTAFVLLYRWTRKPIMVVIATRYETPFTLNEKAWLHLNESLREGIDEGQILISTNNRADADYLQFFAGVSAQVIPSFCDKNEQWTGCKTRRLILARDSKLIEVISSETSGRYVSARSPSSLYTWKHICESSEVLYIPQNVSTMTLFELSTAGVPVAIPSAEWMADLSEQYTGILDELSFIQVSCSETPAFLENTPADPNWDQFYEWWQLRADWNNKELMPNVRIVTGIQDLLCGETAPQLHGLNYPQKIADRNKTVRALQADYVDRFLRLIN